MDSQPAISPGRTRCRAYTKQWLTASNSILKTIIPLCHGDSFVLPSNAFFSTTNMHKQLMSQQYPIQGDNNSIINRLLFRLLSLFNSLLST